MTQPLSRSLSARWLAMVMVLDWTVFGFLRHWRDELNRGGEMSLLV